MKSEFCDMKKSLGRDMSTLKISFLRNSRNTPNGDRGNSPGPVSEIKLIRIAFSIFKKINKN